VKIVIIILSDFSQLDYRPDGSNEFTVRYNRVNIKFLNVIEYHRNHFSIARKFIASRYRFVRSLYSKFAKP